MRKYRSDRKALCAQHREERRLFDEKFPPKNFGDRVAAKPVVVAGIEYPSKRAALVSLGLAKPSKRKAAQAEA